MTQFERRRHRRLNIQLPLELRWRDPEGQPALLRTITQNVSTGGLYFETDTHDLEPRKELEVELRIPPGGGVSPFEGRATVAAEVLRIDNLGPRTPTGVPRFGVAAAFRSRLKLRY